LSKEARALFGQGCESILAKPVEVKQQWLARIKLARIHASMTSALGESLQQERHTMMKWLQGKT
jgi:hypothetical protein